MLGSSCVGVAMLSMGLKERFQDCQGSSPHPNDRARRDCTRQVWSEKGR